jgi:hypothetical protein
VRWTNGHARFDGRRGAGTHGGVLTNGNHFARIILGPVASDPHWCVRGIVHISGDDTGNTGLRAAIAVGRRTTVPYLVYEVTSAAAFAAAHRLSPSLARDESVASERAGHRRRARAPRR